MAEARMTVEDLILNLQVVGFEAKKIWHQFLELYAIGKDCGSFRLGGRAGQRLRLGHFCAEKMTKTGIFKFSMEGKDYGETDGRKKGTG